MATATDEMKKVHNASVASIPYKQSGSSPQAHKGVVSGANFVHQYPTHHISTDNSGGLKNSLSNAYSINVQHSLSNMAKEDKKKLGI